MFVSSILLASSLLTNAADVASAVSAADVGARFSFAGTVTTPIIEKHRTLHMTDPSGKAVLLDEVETAATANCRPGDLLQASGIITNSMLGFPVARCNRLELLEHRPPAPPSDATAEDLISGRMDMALVRIRGTVQEVFRDEIDSRWIFFTVNCQGYPVYAAIKESDGGGRDFKSLADAEVSITGVCDPPGHYGYRKLIGRIITVFGADDIRTLLSAASDPFSVPEIETPSDRLDPFAIATIGRRRLAGHVVAVRHKGGILLRDPVGEIHDVTFREGPPPAYGTFVEVAGRTVTDLFRINFSDAIWRQTDGPALPDEPPLAMTARELFTDKIGGSGIKPTLHGRTIRISGTITDGIGDPNVIAVQCDGRTIPVDIGSIRPSPVDLVPGCTVDISGTCVLETATWHPYSVFPHVTGLTVVARTPADIRIVSRPPWLTVGRLLVATALLFLALIVIVVWNRMLMRIVDRKSRQLLKEQIAQIGSEFRIGERTNLAIELHDSLSQNLSGISCQIAATKGEIASAPAVAAAHLETAERMLGSCRTELRRCLWDLRNNALEEPDFATAIRKTVAPVAGDAQIALRFNVPRNRLIDSTAHSVICIIRELVANAVVHGKADRIRIAGEFHEDALSFSVTDNGTGFDTARRQGPREGHFGLEGIAERVKRLNGRFEIRSAPGETKAVITVRPPDRQNGGRT